MWFQIGRTRVSSEDYLGVLDYKGKGVFALDKRFSSFFFEKESDFFINPQKIHMTARYDAPVDFDIPLALIGKDNTSWWLPMDGFSGKGALLSLDALEKDVEMRTAIFTTNLWMRKYCKAPAQKASVFSNAFVQIKMSINFNSDFFDFYAAEGDSYQTARKAAFVKIN